MDNFMDLIERDIDVREDAIEAFDGKLLEELLTDRTTGGPILWGTTDYFSHGKDYGEFCPIKKELITGENGALIQPRIKKIRSTCDDRTRERAEVFTPAWVCNKQNNLVDGEWFRRGDVFNREKGIDWEPASGKISFEGAQGDWKAYVTEKRLEITCGEAPYLVSRYDASSGEMIPLPKRIGLLDRKMRVVRENTESKKEWLEWSKRAFQSVYGYEYQGDNLLLARENLLLSYIDYHRARLGKKPDKERLNEIAEIISWNLWQMDGLKYVVPGSCNKAKDQMDVPIHFDSDANVVEDPTECPACRDGVPFGHIGTKCLIKDWEADEKTEEFLSMLKRGETL